MADKKTYLKPSTDKILNWDWWRENPVEIVLVAFILILFFFLPRQGCGVSEKPGVQQEQPAVPAPVQPAANG